MLARGLCKDADALVMTHKDWVKFRPLLGADSWPVPIVVPWLEIDVFDGADALLAAVLAVVEKRGQAPISERRLGSSPAIGDPK